MASATAEARERTSTRPPPLRSLPVAATEGRGGAVLRVPGARGLGASPAGKQAVEAEEPDDRAHARQTCADEPNVQLHHRPEDEVSQLICWVLGREFNRQRTREPEDGHDAYEEAEGEEADENKALSDRGVESPNVGQGHKNDGEVADDVGKRSAQVNGRPVDTLCICYSKVPRRLDRTAAKGSEAHLYRQASEVMMEKSSLPKSRTIWKARCRIRQWECGRSRRKSSSRKPRL